MGLTYWRGSALVLPGPIRIENASVCWLVKRKDFTSLLPDVCGLSSERNHHRQTSQPAKTPNDWFCQRYPNQFEKYCSPFLELVEPADNFTVQILPLSINLDFFAGVLGGRRDLGHHVIYFEPEMQWYFRDSDGIYKPTTAEKLGNLYRGLMMKCAQDMLPNVHKLNLFHE